MSPKVTSIWEMWPYWNQGLCRCNQVKIRSHWSRMSPKPSVASVLIRGKRGHRDTGTRTCDNGGRNRNGSVVVKEHQGAPAATSSQEGGTDRRLHCPRPASRTWDNQFLLFEGTQFLVVCCDSPKKLIQRQGDSQLRVLGPFPHHQVYLSDVCKIR